MLACFYKQGWALSREAHEHVSQGRHAGDAVGGPSGDDSDGKLPAVLIDFCSAAVVVPTPATTPAAPIASVSVVTVAPAVHA